MTTPPLSSRQWIDPIEWLVAQGLPTGHITYDPTLTPRSCQYRIVRNASHDGTVCFTDELIRRVLSPLVEGTSFFAPEPLSPDEFPVYVVGPIRLATVFPGAVALPCGRYPGQRERIRLPVRCIRVRVS